MNFQLHVKETISLAYINSEIFLLRFGKILAADKSVGRHACHISLYLKKIGRLAVLGVPDLLNLPNFGMRDFVTYYLLKGLNGVQNQGVNALDNYETKKILLQLCWSSGIPQYFILKKKYSDFLAAYTRYYSLLHLPEAWLYYHIVHSITFYQFVICFDFEYGFYKLILVHGCFSCFLNWANGTKSSKAAHLSKHLSEPPLWPFSYLFTYLLLYHIFIMTIIKGIGL